MPVMPMALRSTRSLASAQKSAGDLYARTENICSIPRGAYIRRKKHPAWGSFASLVYRYKGSEIYAKY